MALLAKRGMRVDHSTIHRWTVRFSPLLLKRFTRRNCPGVMPSTTQATNTMRRLSGNSSNRLFEDVSDRTVGHLVFLEQLLATTLAAPHYLSPILRMVHFAESSHSGHSAPDRHPMRAATRTG
jgi:hypothetical protein